MIDTSLAFTTPAGISAWKRWLLYSPLARIVMFALGFYLLSQAIGRLDHATWLHNAARTPWNNGLAYLSIFVLSSFLIYLGLVKLVERRRMVEWSPRNWTGVWAGIIGGVLLFTVAVGALWLVGSYHVTGTNPHADWLLALLMVALGAGIGEEILFRGVLFRIVEEGLGTWGALLISALFFGAAHIMNPGATLWSAAAITVEAGLLLGMIYHLTRSLWPCIGLHAAWNFTQGTVYGIPVSGTHADGWLVSQRTGPDWLSGGAFGAEASVVMLSLCSVCTVVLIVVAVRRGSIVPPCWRRKTSEAISARNPAT
ncbi:CPBP family intramembrane metalloprotease [Dyella sp. M7H15-1]|uniref:CPBP family intramembrane glutamic endopeptidase n=1 Tax=Dyella sp. M7H15-1 TaxID=2501295 RepID=UPI0010051142|nr:type II CAAX endopeptidase family protein [Dyella sp. M7H15-1]QAU22767.1 CPBP family intramembrane metalloprotease [Dyella sp. M7H15-1]